MTLLARTLRVAAVVALLGLAGCALPQGLLADQLAVAIADAGQINLRVGGHEPGGIALFEEFGRLGHPTHTAAAQGHDGVRRLERVGHDQEAADEGQPQAAGHKHDGQDQEDGGQRYEPAFADGRTTSSRCSLSWLFPERRFFGTGRQQAAGYDALASLCATIQCTASKRSRATKSGGVFASMAARCSAP